jgi:Domain of unknown function (DUF4157)
MRPTYARRRTRRSAGWEAATFKKENQQEQTFFGDAVHDSFFKPAIAVPQAGIQRKCADCKKEEKVQRMAGAKEEEKVQRAPVKKEEEKVQRMPEKKEEEKVQRMAGPKEEEKVQRAPEKKEEEKLQKKEAAPTVVAPANTASNYISSINGKGQPLSSGLQHFYGSRIGADFSDVKIHTGQEATQSATEINAQAYTYGNNVVFNEGKYRPETNEGKRLLAHELAHVAQQHGNKTEKAYRVPFPPEEDPIHSGIADDYRQRRGLPASGTDGTGQVMGPSDGEIIHQLAPAVATLIAELRTAYATGGVTALFARMRTLTPGQRVEPELADFVAATLAGNELWAANTLLAYGPETAWPIPLRVRRELLPLTGSGGFAQVLAVLGSATDAEKVAVINDAVAMDLMRALTAAERQQLGTILLNLTIVPTGNARAAAALLLFSSELIDRNTATHIANGRISIYYYENLQQPPNLAQVLASAGLDPALYTAYLEPPENTVTFYVQLNAEGSQRGTTSKIMGRQALSVDRWQTLLVHETNHARNAHTRTGTAAEVIARYKSEFRAYWVAEFRGVSDLAARAAQIKAHILRDYAVIRAQYNADATVKAAIDAHLTPDGNTTNQ